MSKQKEKSNVDRIVEEGLDKLERVYRAKEDPPGPGRYNYDPEKCYKIISQSKHNKID